MNENTLEFFFELPESLKPFGLAPGETTKKGVEEVIKRENAWIMTDEQPSPTPDNLYNPNTTEMVIGRLKDIFGFKIKGVILNFYKDILDKLFCIFEHGDQLEVDFFNILTKLEHDVFGQPSIIQTSAEASEWEISWNYKFFSISLILHRDLSDLMLAFFDKSLQRVLQAEEEVIFAEYVERQMEDSA